MRLLSCLLAAALALLLLAGGADASPAGRRLLQRGFAVNQPNQQAQRSAASMTQASIRYAADNPGTAYGATATGAVTSSLAAAPCTLPYGVTGCVDYYAGQWNNYWGKRRRAA
ncbi:hypothetical protein Rsub_06862 [Raphidocelis subcapitata]|uniref:Uncharacterized protein n=1 Tax=Raphidocelis subcapitata TaxID=307507 RepID=A0A2V0P7K6_9CHLO|nr:hypothetical protein Rsub_06862 [Raphidocelis subcapitata]|eukprot:GBF93863.1 hypothetical protein Rsub_06862 [Raphidocelis subcapitata]